MIQDDERFAQRIAEQLRAPERVDETFTARVMAAAWTIAALRPNTPPAGSSSRDTLPRERSSAAASISSPAAGRAGGGWWRHAITIRVTPLGALAAAAGVALAAGLGGTVWHRLRPEPPPATVSVASARGAAPVHDTTYVVRFVLIAPSASSVTLVGDFNNWNRGALHLVPTGQHGVWTAPVALPAGQHEYAFIVDGTHWTADPHAALTVTDDFGTQSSILTVGSVPPTPAT